MTGGFRVKKEVHPGFEPGLLESDHVVKIQSDNHYTNEPGTPPGDGAPLSCC